MSLKVGWMLVEAWTMACRYAKVRFKHENFFIFADFCRILTQYLLQIGFLIRGVETIITGSTKTLPEKYIACCICRVEVALNMVKLNLFVF